MNFKIDKIVFLDMFLSINHGIPLKIVTRHQFLTENQNNNKKISQPSSTAKWRPDQFLLYGKVLF